MLLSLVVLDNVVKHLKYEDVDNLSKTCKKLREIISLRRGYAGECDDKHGYYPNSRVEIYEKQTHNGDFNYWRGKLHGYQIFGHRIIHVHNGVIDKFIVSKDKNYLHGILREYSNEPAIGVGCTFTDKIFVCSYERHRYVFHADHVKWVQPTEYTALIYPDEIIIYKTGRDINKGITLIHKNIQFLYDCFNMWDMIDLYLREYVVVVPWGTPVHYSRLYWGNKKMVSIIDCLKALDISVPDHD